MAALLVRPNFLEHIVSYNGLSHGERILGSFGREKTPIIGAVRSLNQTVCSSHLQIYESELSWILYLNSNAFATSRATWCSKLLRPVGKPMHPPCSATGVMSRSNRCFVLFALFSWRRNLRSAFSSCRFDCNAGGVLSIARFPSNFRNLSKTPSLSQRSLVFTRPIFRAGCSVGAVHSHDSVAQ